MTKRVAGSLNGQTACTLTKTGQSLQFVLKHECSRYLPWFHPSKSVSTNGGLLYKSSMPPPTPDVHNMPSLHASRKWNMYGHLHLTKRREDLHLCKVAALSGELAQSGHPHKNNKPSATQRNHNMPDFAARMLGNCRGPNLTIQSGAKRLGTGHLYWLSLWTMVQVQVQAQVQVRARLLLMLSMLVLVVLVVLVAHVVLSLSMSMWACSH
mmetsp:Transcript_13524/g.23308  ORF Transcript_13524/g.23308 Transcript_13524/m.23308 type:complete len:210 (+) Transcript_13524:38-667(+)